jgi:hypothetical protein
MSARKAWSLLPWQKQAIIDAYLAGDKVDAIAVEFGVVDSYPGILARRRGHPMRPRRNRLTHSKTRVSGALRISPVIG